MSAKDQIWICAQDKVRMEPVSSFLVVSTHVAMIKSVT